MTKINDYLWHLPHTPEDDDPPDVQQLQQSFNAPLVAMLTDPLGKLNYQLKSNDVMVKLDSQMDVDPEDETTLQNTYTANVRFIAYIGPDILLRVHFEHTEWAHFLSTADKHAYYINLDRFKVQDPRTQIAVPAWSGRLHTRLSNNPDSGLHHSGEDQIWAFSSAEELEQQVALFLQKFQKQGHPWLTDERTL